MIVVLFGNKIVLVQVVDLDRRRTQTFGGPPHVKTYAHPWPQEINILTWRAKQRHKRKNKRNLFATVTMDNAGFVTPKDLANDAVVEVVFQLLFVTVGEECIFFHGLGEKHLVHGATGRHHGKYPFTLRNHHLNNGRSWCSKRLFERF